MCLPDIHLELSGKLLNIVVWSSEELVRDGDFRKKCGDHQHRGEMQNHRINREFLEKE